MMLNHKGLAWGTSHLDIFFSNGFIGLVTLAATTLLAWAIMQDNYPDAYAYISIN